MATAKLLDDIMQCPICTEMYTDPRVLPCVHMYCLKCIMEWSKDKQPEDKVACPLCRKEFTLPSNGVEGLPKNFYVASFLEMKELLSVESKTNFCEVCNPDEESGSEVQIVASDYCFECQMKLCRKCAEQHKVIKATRSHKPVSIGQYTDAEILYQFKPPTRCDKHKDDILKLYCFECKSAICMMCSAISHRNHECNDIDAVADDFRKQMAYDANDVAAGIDKCREMLDSIEKEKNEFIEQVEKTGVAIIEKAEQLKQMIDAHKEKLLNKLSSFKEKRMKEIQIAREEIERQLLSRESYKKYVDEVRQKGTACDIATAASSLRERADELQKNDDAERTLADLGHVDVTFTSSDFVVDDAQKTLGHLTPGSTTAHPILRFLTTRRYASAAYAVMVCPSVRHKSEFNQDG